MKIALASMFFPSIKKIECVGNIYRKINIRTMASTQPSL